MPRQNYCLIAPNTEKINLIFNLKICTKEQVRERRNVAGHWNGRNCKTKLQRKKNGTKNGASSQENDQMRREEGRWKTKKGK